MFDLTGKTAIITGAARGLGAAMACGLAEFGANVAIFDVIDGRDTCREIAATFEVQAKFYEVDVTEEARIEEAVGEVVEDLGAIDILINNAGVYYPTPVTETDLADWQYLLDVDLTGYFLMAKHAIPLMPDGGRIVNIASIAGHSAFEQSAAYCVAKGGVIELTKSLAYEFGARGIRVNAICPGTFVTEMTADMLEDEDFMETMRSQVPLGRPGRPEELKGLAVYLASDASSYMTGTIIDIDGGWTCHV
ncbi:MAG: SDR family NAD(P)-dependent oxidoreductase [Armatimonadota bacterium]|jgi:NAD(P)-dependent dehydrogenase (short-subunit alcohol dehydrogenase family)